MELNAQQLSEIKQELKKFSSTPISKSYKLIAQIYKGNIETQALIDSEITKSIVRIGQKKYTEDDEEKYAKAIKICRKLVKQWKQLILTNDQAATDHIKKEEPKKELQRIVQKQKPSKVEEPIIQKKVRQEQEKKEIKPIQHKNGNSHHTKLQNNDSQNGKGEPVDEEKRKKAVEGLKKYFYQQTQKEEGEWSKKIEQAIFDLHKSSVQEYMDRVKSVVKLIDRNAEFRSKLLNGEFDLVSEIKNLK
ncbi:unnamed protein product (macronuclear) [Paramecium tetraurelia]|uniref:TFIIS N-terminal domain-containing protein n=1 Tax=Paramecium tetraurelia TaxID=5888 RepID=A0E1A6_PARTE|nr:uncharacterized protein GSPATT00022242001 [Paramecium tetraurelia]CAK89073.1 unnamed protein product [Paramecium tetraurelia]|eukprot:XP_001456470.1 hypothetical protein (macronuclear) [Paramecium tetraurelia strain d4-2]